MIQIRATQKALSGELILPSSKSECNRALIIQALSHKKINLLNLSEARDTQTLMTLLELPGFELDAMDAGTTFRFMTAWLCAISENRILTGSHRMQERPVGILVDALRSLGADIRYLHKPGFPPLHINCKTVKLSGGSVQMRGDVSSQFISALLMIGPVLPGGLTLELTTPVGSRPYIEMTLNMMKHFGVSSKWENNRINIPEGAYTANSYSIEPDWSAAGYWYSMAALAPEADIFLPGLREYSWQGDSRIANLMTHFGLQTEFTPDGARITKTSTVNTTETLDIDFTDIPDQAQTFAVLAAATGKELILRGLESLRIKETDRILALQTELGKFGIRLEEIREAVFSLSGDFHPTQFSVSTYKDHRMAMAFAPLAFLQDSLHIKDHEVVQKSYPRFWEDLRQIAGWEIRKPATSEEPE
jgi:3-phosphoshikimate 1-carboxyvinyltransferase